MANDTRVSPDSQWAQPQEVSDVFMAFPANVGHLMPPYEEIPDEFKGFGRNPWCEFQSTWFYRGLNEATEVYARDGVDPEKAFRHLKAIQGSFEPKHEHKAAAVAYLASLWLERVENYEPTGDPS